MDLPEEALLLRIFVGEATYFEGKPAFEAIVLKARELGLAGATVLRASLGYGASSHFHTVKILRLSYDLPLVVEIVDAEDKINAFLPVVDKMIDSGLVTIERARVIHYRHKPVAGADAAT